MQHTRAADRYSPLYFLASVGAGGVVVTFFMYLLYWVPHPGQTVPVFEDIVAAWSAGTPMLKTAIAVALAGIAIFTVMNLQKLVWNIRAHAAWKQTAAYETLRNSNAETTLLAYPLALAMSVNALFIAGLVFVPGLWSVVEYLFPVALAVFLAIGGFALWTIGDFLGRVLTRGGVFDVTAHNSFAQLLPTFALSMVAVGLAAPASMSANSFVVSASVMTSTFFGTTALVYGVVALITAFNSMLHYGTHKETAPTLLIIIPVMTTLGIMFLRQDHGLHVHFTVHKTAGETMVFLSRLLAVQAMFLLLGLTVLVKHGYFKDYVFGRMTSAGSYALVCPGIALSVMIQFFVNKGLVAAEIIPKYGAIYWIETAVALGFQLAMIALLVRLNRQHFARNRAQTATPLTTG